MVTLYAKSSPEASLVNRLVCAWWASAMQEPASSTKEASGEDLDYSVTMMHGQDHLMTTILLKDLMHHLIELYKRGVK